MRKQSSVKQEFIKKWISGLRRYTCEKKNMSLLERKKAIKVSADLAMASTRDKTTRWSQALIAAANASNKVITEHVLSSSSSQNNNRTNSSTRNSTTTSFCRSRIRRSRKILRRSRTRSVYKAKEKVVASLIARKLVEKRTRRLKSLVPGGEFMDDVSLVEETLDYIQSLTAQVQVMRSLLTASQLSLHN